MSAGDPDPYGRTAEVARPYLLGMPMRPLLISAPFGNYIQPPNTTPTLGTFTAMRRRGRVPQILRTVRYYPRIGAWVNKIGLRNPGIDWLAGKVADGKIDPTDKLVSIHGFDAAQWATLLEKACALKPLGVELNMSCPNVGEIGWPEGFFGRAVEAASAAGTEAIVKLPPVNWELMAEQAHSQGVRTFHCCNTLPNPKGGISGKPLLPVALTVVRAMRERYSAEVTLVGGGGITGPEDIAAYRDAGADHFAIGTKVMNPLYLVTDRGLAGIRAAV